MKAFLWVFLGGGIGSMGRYALALWLKRFASAFPIHTLAVNLLGCLLIGFLTGYLAKHANPSASLLLVTGFCGGFTTFSTFSLESLTLFNTGHSTMAMVYIATSFIVCLAATAAGLSLCK